MARSLSENREPTASTSMLEIKDLHVHYGRAHVLQGVSLSLESGVLAVVGRNGMGKTTLCNAIMGLIPSRGSIKVAGREIAGITPNRIVAEGLGYVPQGRRVWPSLSVDEHLRVAARGGRRGAWTVSRIYELFPRLAERKANGGGQLSGGEQQMLAIGRALLAQPRVLIMDEPTEGLAPVIVQHVSETLKALATAGDTSILLVEQNLGVATDVSDDVAIMVGGRIARLMRTSALAADTDLQHRLLGVKSSGDDELFDVSDEMAVNDVTQATVVDESEATEAVPVIGASAPTAWSGANSYLSERSQATPDETGIAAAEQVRLPPITIAQLTGRAAYIVGTFDTKARELLFIKARLDRQGVRTITVDVSTSHRPSPTIISPAEVARYHPGGGKAVFTGDRGSAVSAMALAFERFIITRRDLGGIISAGGSGGTALVAPGFRALPVGTPKVLVSTVASGDVKPYVGPADICMMYSVTDVQGINRISEQVLANAANALAGMIGFRSAPSVEAKPAIGLTMFGVTTPCVQMVSKALESRYDMLTFHATGTGGQSMEKLVDSGLLVGVIDVTTTEVADLHMGGVFSAGPDRMGAIIRSGLPYVGSCGALDMVNFGAMDTVPEKYRGRNLYLHNPQVTLMRTTPEENEIMGRWIATRLNQMQGAVRFLLPLGGVSLIDAPGKPFYDPEADRRLFDAIEQDFVTGPNRRLIKLQHNINDPAFADALVDNFNELAANQNNS